MSQLVLTDAKILMGAYDLSGAMNAVALDAEADVRDKTTFGSTGWRSFAPGLKRAALQGEGFFDAGAGLADNLLGLGLGVANQPCSVAPSSTEGGVAYTVLGTEGAYQIGGQLGDMLGFSLTVESQGAMIRGLLGLSPATTRNATGSGTISQLGAVGSGQSLYAALHCVNFTGTSLVMRIQSAALVGFGSPTTRATFTTLISEGSQWITPVAGPITDQFWRADWTFSGSLFQAALIFGIL